MRFFSTTNLKRIVIGSLIVAGLAFALSCGVVVVRATIGTIDYNKGLAAYNEQHYDAALPCF
jgi:hypothetical protein